MTTKRWIGWAAALAGGLFFASAAAAATRRDAGTQIGNNVHRLVMPVQRQIDRLARQQFAVRGEDPGDDSDTGGGSGSGAQRRGDDAFQWSRALAAGKEIEIKGVNGDIVASRAAGREVEVRAFKSAKRSDPEDVTIELIEHEDGVTVCAKYPAARGEENECRPGEGGHMNTHDNDVRVDFEVRVPAGVRLVARTVNGEIRAEGLQGPVEAATVNGSVRVTTSAYASAETVNGSIVATLGSAQWPEPAAFATVNGEIRLTLPGKLDANVRAETLNGRIESDFPVTVNGRLGRHRLQGTIGKGGPRLELETVNGDIVLRSAS